MQMLNGLTPIDVIVDGTDISIKGKDGMWRKKEQSAKTKEVLKNMLGENFNGSINSPQGKQDMKDITKNYEIKRNRSADGWLASFGNNRAVDFVPKGKPFGGAQGGQKMFARKTAWIDRNTGVTMESAVYDENGKEIVHHKTKRVDTINNCNLATETESDSQTPQGKIHSHRVMQNVFINQDISGEFK